MKKMMFNDRYGLTKAVVRKTKGQTRRLMENQSDNLAGQIKYTKRGSDLIYVRADFDNGITEDCPYAIGEIVAVAQSYSDAGIDFIPCDLENPRKWGCTHRMEGWTNKMFVRAEIMPHQIRIIDVRAERLQDITEEDCLRDTPEVQNMINKHYKQVERLGGRVDNNLITPRNAYAHIIDKISGKGTWERNPFVWRIEFELVK